VYKIIYTALTFVALGINMLNACLVRFAGGRGVVAEVMSVAGASSSEPSILLGVSLRVRVLLSMGTVDGPDVG
jgi:hypothetical protein